MAEVTMAGNLVGGERPAPEGDGRIGLVLRDPLPWTQCLEIVQTAEDTGYEAVFVPEIAGREAFSTLAGFAGATDRLLLGTGVVTIGSRGPVATAMAAATVQDLSGGRMVLGVGAGSTAPTHAGSGGSRARGPLDLVRGYVRLVRSILAGEPVAGTEPFAVPPFRLELASTRPPPIWLGALGDRMIHLAGEVADGVLLNWCTPGRVAEARSLIGAGARAAGREPAEVTIAVYVRACLGIEEAVALDALGEMTGRYASVPSYRRQFETMGLGGAAGMAAAAFEAGKLQDVPEDLVRELTVVGGRREALDRFDRYREAGADVLLCYPVTALDPFSSVLGTLMAAAPSPAVER